jgi:hypothetical protein
MAVVSDIWKTARSKCARRPAPREEGTAMSPNLSRRELLVDGMRVATAIPLAGLSGCATNADKSVGDQPDAGQAAPAPSIDDLAWWQKTVVYECYP